MSEREDKRGYLGSSGLIVPALLSILLCVNYGGMALMVGFWPLLILVVISLVSGYVVYRGRKVDEKQSGHGSSDTG